MLDVRFASGDILALRRFPVASIGIGYTSVWHRSADGEWTLFTDVPCPQGCARYFKGLIARAIVSPIRIDWVGAGSMVIEVDGGDLLRWHLDLAASTATAAFNAAAGWLPPTWWTNRYTLTATETVVDFALRAGRLRLVHRIPAGLRMRALPQAIWRVDGSRAVLRGRDLGLLQSEMPEPGPAGIWPPRRALFAAGALIVHPANCT